jgi:hypothetical protein
MIRVPGILAGLKERSQSAYAAPMPNPVDSAIGQVLPTHEKKERQNILEQDAQYKMMAGEHERRNRITEATTPILNPKPLTTLSVSFLSKMDDKTHVLTSKSAT